MLGAPGPARSRASRAWQAARANVTPLIVGTFVVGLAVGVLGRSGVVGHVRYGGIRVGEIVVALGDAFVLAALLAVLVDRRLKDETTQSIARETSDLTSRATAEIFFREFLGGDHMPREYFDGMRRIASTTSLSVGVAWRLDLRWAGDYLRIESCASNNILNTGVDAWEQRRPWLIQHRDGRPASMFIRYDAAVTVHPAERTAAPSIARASIDLPGCAALSEPTSDGVRLALTEADLLVTPPGAIITLDVAGVTYHEPVGLMPLVVGSPTLGMTLDVTGDALSTLDLSVAVGMDRLAPDRVTDRVGNEVLRFRWPDLALAGTTIRVQWRPRPLPD